MAAITDLASLCEASGFEPEDLLGSTAEDLADLFEEFEVKGKAKIQVKKELRQLAPATHPPSTHPPSPAAAARGAGTEIMLPAGVRLEVHAEVVGRGGSGVVHTGTLHDRGGSKKVAVKMLGAGASAKQQSDFVKEIRKSLIVAARCEGVVLTYGALELGGRTALVRQPQPRPQCSDFTPIFIGMHRNA